MHYTNKQTQIMENTQNTQNQSVSRFILTKSTNPKTFEHTYTVVEVATGQVHATRKSRRDYVAATFPVREPGEKTTSIYNGIGRVDLVHAALKGFGDLDRSHLLATGQTTSGKTGLAYLQEAPVEPDPQDQTPDQDRIQAAHELLAQPHVQTILEQRLQALEQVRPGALSEAAEAMRNREPIPQDIMDAVEATEPAPSELVEATDEATMAVADFNEYKSRLENMGLPVNMESYITHRPHLSQAASDAIRLSREFEAVKNTPAPEAQDVDLWDQYKTEAQDEAEMMEDVAETLSQLTGSEVIVHHTGNQEQISSPVQESGPDVTTEIISGQAEMIQRLEARVAELQSVIYGTHGGDAQAKLEEELQAAKETIKGQSNRIQELEAELAKQKEISKELRVSWSDKYYNFEKEAKQTISDLEKKLETQDKQLQEMIKEKAELEEAGEDPAGYWTQRISDLKALDGLLIVLGVSLPDSLRKSLKLTIMDLQRHNMAEVEQLDAASSQADADALQAVIIQMANVMGCDQDPGSVLQAVRELADLLDDKNLKIKELQDKVKKQEPEPVQIDSIFLDYRMAEDALQEIAITADINNRAKMLQPWLLKLGLSLDQYKSHTGQVAIHQFYLADLLRRAADLVTTEKHGTASGALRSNIWPIDAPDIHKVNESATDGPYEPEISMMTSDVLAGLNMDKAVSLYKEYEKHCKEKAFFMMDQESFVQMIIKGVMVTQGGKNWSLDPDQKIPRPWTQDRELDAQAKLADSGRPIAEQKANQERRRQLLQDLEILVKAKKITITTDVDGWSADLETDTTGELI